MVPEESVPERGDRYHELQALGQESPQGPRLNILFLADAAHPARVVRDHIAALCRHSRHRWQVINPTGSSWRGIGTFRHFDVVVVHYSLFVLKEYFLPEAVAERISNYRGPKVQFIQDEYRFIDKMAARMAELGMNAVISSLSLTNLPKVYHHDELADVHFYSNLPGYVPERLKKASVPATRHRLLDVVYRGRPLPYWLGRAAQEKNEIGERFAEFAREAGLKVDIELGEGTRVYGKKWEDLLTSGKATLAVEGGASIFDFDGSVQQSVYDYLAKHPRASFEEVHAAVLAPYEGNIVHRTITPRIMEAAALRTALVLYPGEYRGFLQPWRHYLPLERDGSNWEEIARLLRDEKSLEEIVSRAYQEVACNPRLSAEYFATCIDRLIEKTAQQVGGRPKGSMAAMATAALWRTRLACERMPKTLRANLNKVIAKYWGRRCGLEKPSPEKSVETSDQEGADTPQKAPLAKVASHPKDVLLIGNCNLGLGEKRSPILVHLMALTEQSRHRVVLVDFKAVTRLGIALERFDAVVLHYSIVPWMDHYLPPEMRERIAAYGGLKVAFLQDEYRWIDKSAGVLAELGIDVLFSVVNEEIRDRIYHHKELRNMKRVTVLTGYLDEKLVKKKVPPFEQRLLDVGYRARKLPAWLGEFAQEKWRIGQRFLQDAPRYGLRCDISWKESDRLYGRRWIHFMESCKAVLGTESGASVCDFSDRIRQQVEEHLARDPEAPFEVLRDKYFREEDGRMVVHVISPRHFEAAALRTLMIMYPGDYSGILKPWRHYVPLERDHSNMDEVVEVLRNPRRAQEIIQTAYEEVAKNPQYSLRCLTEMFDNLISSKTYPLAPGIRRELPPMNEIAWRAHRLWRQQYWQRHFTWLLKLVDAIKRRQYIAKNYTGKGGRFVIRPLLGTCLAALHFIRYLLRHITSPYQGIKRIIRSIIRVIRLIIRTIRSIVAFVINKICVPLYNKLPASLQPMIRQKALKCLSLVGLADPSRLSQGDDPNK